jgi:hypothetical protein
MKMTSLLQYRRTVVLAALLFLSALLYVLNSVQPAAVQGLRSAVLDVYSPVLWAGDWLRRQVAKPFETLFAYDALKRENEALKIEVAELRARYDGLSDAHQSSASSAVSSGVCRRGLSACILEVWRRRRYLTKVGKRGLWIMRLWSPQEGWSEWFARRALIPQQCKLFLIRIVQSEL